MSWNPQTAEDYLLGEYLTDFNGSVYLEFPLRLLVGEAQARRVDALLVPHLPVGIYEWGSYDPEEVSSRAEGAAVEIVEAKRRLNRGVIGQLQVARYLIAGMVSPSSISLTALVGAGNADLESYCSVEGIHTVVQELPKSFSTNDPATGTVGTSPRVRPTDERHPADEARRRAFLAGWSAAVKGRLYASVRSRRTHANMGNLFGWIYGDQSPSFRMETWQRYVKFGFISEQDGEE